MADMGHHYNMIYKQNYCNIIIVYFLFYLFKYLFTVGIQK